MKKQYYHLVKLKTGMQNNALCCVEEWDYVNIINKARVLEAKAKN